MSAFVLLLLLAAGTPGWCSAQIVEQKDAKKADVEEADAALKKELVLHFDECKVPEGKTFTAEVQLKVTPAGLPEKVVLSKSSGYPCLDAVAVAAVDAARFSPARQHGKPVTQDLVMPIDFTRVDMAQNQDPKSSGGMTAAKILRKPPLESGNCKVQSGSHLGAVVGLTVDSQGKPTNVHIVQTTGDPCLDDVALKDAAQYVFDPAKRNGRAVDFEMKIEMVFAQ